MTITAIAPWFGSNRMLGPEVGNELRGCRYKFNAGKTEAAERDWHARLRDCVQRFKLTRVVMRFYDHPLIRELYREDVWTWRRLKGRDQANNDKAEVLLINGPSYGSGGLF